MPNPPETTITLDKLLELLPDEVILRIVGMVLRSQSTQYDGLLNSYLTLTRLKPFARLIKDSALWGELYKVLNAGQTFPLIAGGKLASYQDVMRTLLPEQKQREHQRLSANIEQNLKTMSFKELTTHYSQVPPQVMRRLFLDNNSVAFIAAFERNELDILRWVLSFNHPNSLVTHCSQDVLRGCLLKAYQENDLARVMLLIEHGADPRIADADSNSLIELSIRDERLEWLQAFHNAGVDLNNINTNRSSILHRAACLCKPNVIEWILKYKIVAVDTRRQDGNTPLMSLCGLVMDESIWPQRLKIVNTLLDAGAQVNATTPCSDNESVLCFACSYSGCDLKLLKCLVERGADVNNGENIAKPVLYLNAGHMEWSRPALKYLMGKEADMSVRSENKLNVYSNYEAVNPDGTYVGSGKLPKGFFEEKPRQHVRPMQTDSSSTRRR